MRGAIGAKAAILRADKRLPAQLPAHKEDRTKRDTTSLVPGRAGVGGVGGSGAGKYIVNFHWLFKDFI